MTLRLFSLFFLLHFQHLILGTLSCLLSRGSTLFFPFSTSSFSSHCPPFRCFIFFCLSNFPSLLSSLLSLSPPPFLSQVITLRWYFPHALFDMPRVVPRSTSQRALRHLDDISCKVAWLSCVDYTDYFAQQEDVYTACVCLSSWVDQATLCLRLILECDFYFFHNHAVILDLRTALSVYQLYSESPNPQHTYSLARAFDRLHDIMVSFSAYSTTIDELDAFSEDLLHLDTSPRPHAADYAAVFNASLPLISHVRERSLCHTMSHTFFFNAELSAERFSLLYIQEDCVLEAADLDSYMNFRLAMDDFSAAASLMESHRGGAEGLAPPPPAVRDSLRVPRH